MVGDIIHEFSMEAGERWILKDVIEHEFYLWNSSMYKIRIEYDILRRVIKSYMQYEGDPESLIECIVYGEQREDPERRNTRIKIVQAFDQSEIATTDEYDFKGNLLHNEYQLAKEYKAILN